MSFFLPTTTVQETCSTFLLATGSLFIHFASFFIRFRSAFVVSDSSSACPGTALRPIMIAISPRFTFLATLCALAALSSAPISDAAVLRLRASDLASTEVTSNYAQSGASTFLSRRSSHVVDDSPVLPLPKGLGGSSKKPADSGDSLSDSPSDDESHGEKDASTGHDNEDSTYDDSSVVHKKGGKAKVKVRILRLCIYCSHSFE